MKIPHWSHSSLSQYEICPKQYHEVRVVKSVVPTEGEASLYGTRIHKELELAVKQDKPLAEEAKHLQPVVNSIKLAGPQWQEVERKLAIDRDRNPIAFESKDAWCRGVVDWLGIKGAAAIALDYKTGKRKLTDQLLLMALLIFANYPEIDRVYTGFLWLKLNGKVDSQKFDREEIDRLWGVFEERLAKLAFSYEMDQWPARPNGLCKQYCDVVTCRYNGRYKK